MTASPTQPPAPEQGGDPSMEDILASIRRILNEEEPQSGSVSAKDVFELTQAMRADLLPAEPHAPPSEPSPPEPVAHERPPAELHTTIPPAEPAPPTVSQPTPEPVAEPAAAPSAIVAQPPEPPPADAAAAAALVAPSAAAAAAASMSELVRRLASSQNVAVHRGGPTLEDMVREEIRGLLKTWLDDNLPRIVERLVRAEIERVVGRHVG